MEGPGSVRHLHGETGGKTPQTLDTLDARLPCLLGWLPSALTGHKTLEYEYMKRLFSFPI